MAAIMATVSGVAFCCWTLAARGNTLRFLAGLPAGEIPRAA